MTVQRVLVVALFALALPGAVKADPQPTANRGAPVVVTSVTDGDTIRIRDGDTSAPVRVMGIDAPELRQYGRGRPVPLCESAMGDQARVYLERLLASGAVTIRREGKDRFGRVLGWLFVDGQPVAAAMINAGHARAYGGGRRGEWC